jgi:hypothetical protein
MGKINEMKLLVVVVVVWILCGINPCNPKTVVVNLWLAQDNARKKNWICDPLPS